MNKSEKLKSIVLDNIKQFASELAGGHLFQPIGFELCAYDYLAFTEDELDKGTTMSYINCVSHLKRAMDCELDTFFHAFNLLNLFKKRNLKIEQKLEFLKAIGIFSSRSLTRLNTIRNKMEHEYEEPKIND